MTDRSVEKQQPPASEGHEGLRLVVAGHEQMGYRLVTSDAQKTEMIAEGWEVVEVMPVEDALIAEGAMWSDLASARDALEVERRRTVDVRNALLLLAADGTNPPRIGGDHPLVRDGLVEHDFELEHLPVVTERGRDFMERELAASLNAEDPDPADDTKQVSTDHGVDCSSPDEIHTVNSSPSPVGERERQTYAEWLRGEADWCEQGKIVHGSRSRRGDRDVSYLDDEGLAIRAQSFRRAADLLAAAPPPVEVEQDERPESVEWFSEGDDEGSKRVLFVADGLLRVSAPGSRFYSIDGNRLGLAFRLPGDVRRQIADLWADRSDREALIEAGVQHAASNRPDGLAHVSAGQLARIAFLAAEGTVDALAGVAAQPERTDLNSASDDRYVVGRHQDRTLLVRRVDGEGGWFRLHDLMEDRAQPEREDGALSDRLKDAEAAWLGLIAERDEARAEVESWKAVYDQACQEMGALRASKPLSTDVLRNPPDELIQAQLTAEGASITSSDLAELAEPVRSENATRAGLHAVADHLDEHSPPSLGEQSDDTLAQVVRELREHAASEIGRGAWFNTVLEQWAARIEAAELTASGGANWRWPGELPLGGQLPGGVAWHGGLDPENAAALWLGRAAVLPPVDQEGDSNGDR